MKFRNGDKVRVLSYDTEANSPYLAKVGKYVEEVLVEIEDYAIYGKLYRSYSRVEMADGNVIKIETNRLERAYYG